MSPMARLIARRETERHAHHHAFDVQRDFPGLPLLRPGFPPKELFERRQADVEGGFGLLSREGLK